MTTVATTKIPLVVKSQSSCAHKIPLRPKKIPLAIKNVPLSPQKIPLSSKIPLSPKFNWDEIRPYLNLGLCCLNDTLRAQKPTIFCSRTCNRKNFTVAVAQQKTLQNLNDALKLIEWNELHNIKCFRLSSDLFPHYTDPETQSYSMDFARPLMKQIGDLAKKYGHRLLMHPGQYNQVGAEKPEVFQKTLLDLKYHADILDAMGLDDSGVLIVHGGGTYGDLATTKARWIAQFHQLPDNVKRRLVIENCEQCYSTEDCIDIAQACQIPLVFDFHHYYCWSIIKGTNSQKSIRELMPAILKTWGQRAVLMHVSEQAEGKKIGAHSDYVETLPDDLFWTITEFKVHIDLEIEAKAKEKAIKRLYDKYSSLFNFTHSQSLPTVCKLVPETVTVTKKPVTMKAMITVNLPVVNEIKTKIAMKVKL